MKYEKPINICCGNMNVTYYFNEDLTLYENVCKLYQILNEMRETYNDLYNIIEELKIFIDTQIKTYVEEKLIEMLNDGTLQSYIEEIILKIGDLSAYRNFEDEPTVIDKFRNNLNERAVNIIDYVGKEQNIDISETLQTLLKTFNHVYIPSGEYAMTKTVTINANNQLTLSKNAKITRTNADMYCFLTNGETEYTNTNNASIIDSRGKYNANGGFIIDGGIWDCNASINSNGGGFSFAHASGYTIRNVTILNVYNIHHIEINSSTNVLIERCNFTNYKGSATRTFSEAVQIDLASSYGAFPLFGLYDNTISENITISECNFYNVGCGVGTHYQVAGYFNQVDIIKCNFTLMQDNFVNLLAFKRSTISDCNMTTAVNGITVKNSYEIVIKNNNLKFMAENLFNISGVDKIVIDGNISTNGAKVLTSSSTYNATYINNITHMFTGGIVIDTSSFKMLNNIMYDCDYGIQLINSNFNDISHNTFRDFGSYFINIINGGNHRICDNNIYNGNTKNNNSDGIVITNSNNNRIIGNQMRGKLSGVYQVVNAIRIITGTTTYITLNDLRASGSTVLLDTGSQTVNLNNQGV